jgi:hypothetical protein
MFKQLLSYKTNPIKSLKHLPKILWQSFCRYWRKSLWHKFIVIFVIFIGLCLGTMYGIARWYIASESGQPLSLGVTFVPDYAQSLGLNPDTTLKALVDDLHVKHLRLTSYWSDIETSPGQYNFTELDSEFKIAESADAKVTLTLGLRQPRWPECHPPAWAASESTSVWEPQLYSFIQAVVNRYKNSPSLLNYQLENEYFLKGFGACTDFSRSRLVNEYNLVRKADPSHPIIIGRSNNALGFPLGQPQPSEFGISIYKRVWDTHTHRYFEYPIPAWFYGFLAGVQKIFLHKDMLIDELQAEPWPPHGETIPQSSLSEQNKTMNASILKSRFQYGEGTGIRTIYMWGAEYWYYRMVTLHDPSLWNVAKQAIASANATK